MGPSITKRWLSYSLAVVIGSAVAAGCSSKGTGPGDTGTIAITLNPTSASVLQGASATVAATLTRGGGFGGAVALTVEGAPTGVTGVVSNIVTTGTTTTATITINVAATTVPGTYNLTARGTGTGVTDATAAFALTVTALPAAYALTLDPAGRTIGQGGNAQATVNLVRVNFTGAITLSVEGAPAGVTADFNASPTTAAAATLTLTVAGTAVPGTYNLTVRGVAATLTDRTAAFALVVTAASYALSLSAPALSIVQGASTPTTTVNIARTNFTGAVTLSVSGLPANVTATFAPPAPTTDNSVLTLAVGAGAVPGVYNLVVNGTATVGNQNTPLTLTITAAVVGNFTLTTNPAANAGVTQGTSTDVTILVNRTGNFTGTVTFSVTGLVTGLTINLNPTNTSGNTATLTLTAAGSLAVGTYPD